MMNTRYGILLAVVIVAGCWFILTSPVYSQHERPCDVGFEDTVAGYCVPRIGLPSFTIASVYAFEPTPPSVKILLNDGKRSEFYTNDTIQLTVTIPPAYGSQNVVISFTEPSDNKFDDISFSTNDEGNAYVEFEIPDSADIGDYLITARLSDWNYERIEDFERFSIIPQVVCGSNTFLNDEGVCQIIDGGCEPDINGNTTWCGPTYDYWKILFSSPIAMLVVFGIPCLIAGITVVLIYHIRRKRK